MCSMPASLKIALTNPAVVVLPLVPVIRMEPPVKPRDNLSDTSGSSVWATSPGSAVPPPRPAALLSHMVLLPATIAADNRTTSVEHRESSDPSTPFKLLAASICTPFGKMSRTDIAKLV